MSCTAKGTRDAYAAAPMCPSSQSLLPALAAALPPPLSRRTRCSSDTAARFPRCVIAAARGTAFN